MASSGSWDGTTYSIPTSGEVNWPSLSNFLIALRDRAGVTKQMKQAVRVAVATPVTVANATDFAVVINLTVAGATAVSLQAGSDGQIFAIVDGKPDAATNNITITPNGAQTIKGAATLVLNRNSQCVIIQYHAATTDWKVLANILSPGAINAADIGTGTVSNAEYGYLDGVTSAIQTQINTNASSLSDHIADTTDAHAGTALTNTPSGNLAATTVQGALNELQTDVDTRATSSTLTSHTSSISNPHSVTASQVGLGNVDNTSDATKNAASVTLTNKTISGSSNTLTNIPADTAITGLLPLANGGTGVNAATADALLNTLLPSQAANSGKLLSTNGTVSSWASAASSTLNAFNTDIGNSSNTRTATATNLLGDVKANYFTGTFTVTIATPGVFTLNSHGMANGDKFYLTTTGALPTGLSASATYYAANVATNTFNASTSLANAIAGTYVETSGSQSGTHTLVTGGLKLQPCWPYGVTTSFSSTFSFTGAGTTGSLTLRLQRVGDWVTLYLPSCTATPTVSSAALVNNTKIPVGFRPLTVTQGCTLGEMLNSGARTADAGLAQISTAGDISIYRDGTEGTSTFANGSAAGMNRSQTMTYYVGTGS